MTRREKKAIAEVLESYFTPDSPEGLACAMYQLRRIYDEEQTRRKAPRRRTTQGERHRSHSDDEQHQSAARTVGKARPVARGSV